MITIDPPSRRIRNRTELEQFLMRAQRLVGLRGAVDVLLADDATLKRLNMVYRGKKKATDVLSFPAEADFAGVAGDLAISIDTAAKQAAEFGHALGEEIRILLLHGLLHLNGMDHENDEGEMAARELELRKKLKLKTNLIARATR